MVADCWQVALAHAPPINHSWAIVLRVTARGLQTYALPHGQHSFTIAFDFIDHRLVIERSDGDRRTLPLASRSVADFYGEVMAMLSGMSLPVKIWSMPVEIPSPIRFEQDTIHHIYDPRVRESTVADPGSDRARIHGCAVPVHRQMQPGAFFLGSVRLRCVALFGPPRAAARRPPFMREAYSHEVISHGFWPGSAPVREAALYAYAVPEPHGFNTARVLPDAAFYHPELRELILPYEAVRAAASLEAAIAAFVDSTYSQAATLAGCDRAALERPVSATGR